MALGNLPDSFRIKFLNTMQEVGSTVVLKSAGSTIYNTATGNTESTFDEVTYKCDIKAYSSDEIKGSVLSGDIKVRFPNDNIIDISNKDTVIIDGLDYEIKNIMPLLKKDIKVYFDVQVRR